MNPSPMKTASLVAQWQQLEAWRGGLARRDSATLHALIVEIGEPAAAVMTGRLTGLLSEEERARAARLRFDVDRHRFAIAHAVLRVVVGHALGKAPGAIVFAPAPKGGLPPRLAQSSNDAPLLSLSHAGRFVAIALGWGHAVGIDVEWRRSLDDFAGLVRHALTRDEAAALARFAADEQQRIFLRWWTAKEAALKAQGIGFAVPPEEVALHCDEACMPLTATVREAGVARAYAIAALDPGGATDAIAAIASAGHHRAMVAHGNAADLLAMTQAQES